MPALFLSPTPYHLLTALTAERFAGSTPARALPRKNLRQVVHTGVPLSSSSIRYRPRNSDALRLERQPWVGRIEMAAYAGDDCSLMFICFDLFTPVGERTIAISLSVCVSVCSRAYLWNRWTDLRQFFVEISCGRGSVLLRRHCVTLCTSGFMDDVAFGRSGPYGDA